jgi:hypothetical protein
MGASRRSLTYGSSAGHIGKLDDRSTLGVFIGYADRSKAYRILYPGTQRVRTMRDILFDEGRGWTWDKAVDDGSTPTYDNFTVEYVHFEGAGGVGSSFPPSTSTPVPDPPPTSALRCPTTTSAATMSSSPPPQSVPLHSSSDGHPSGHVYSSTSSCRAQPSGVRHLDLSRRGAHRRVLRL